MSKRLTQKELTAVVINKLAKLREGYRSPSELTNPQEREMAQWTLGQIVALDEVRMILLGVRKSFI
jgi:hypothetical protein